ncbi:MAG: hypothetical protein CMP20_09165 [Rickettsiales bacterium]|nr:hypothetical protein [Rickettsiales bacterium]
MQAVLDYLYITGKSPFKRKFAFGQTTTPGVEYTAEDDELDEEYYGQAVEWLVENNIFEPLDASLWWVHVSDPDMPVSAITRYAVNMTCHDIDDRELLEHVLENDLPTTPRLQQWFPEMFPNKDCWKLFEGQATEFKDALVLHFETTLRLWEARYDSITPETMWVCFLTVGIDVNWEILQTPEAFQNTLDRTTESRLLERILSFIKPSDQTAAALQNAEKLLTNNNEIRLYDICRAILPFPGAEYALQLLDVDTQYIESTTVECDNKPRVLRPCQSPFLARIWYLLEAEKAGQDWQSVFLDAIAVFDEPLLEHYESKIALKQFKRFIVDRPPPARWFDEQGRNVLFEITDRKTFLRCLYWFQPEQLFVPFLPSRSHTDMSPVENEQWRYEKWRWNMCVAPFSTKRNRFYIPGFSPVDFNSSILKIARIKEKVVPINRYAPSDL